MQRAWNAIKQGFRSARKSVVSALTRKAAKPPATPVLLEEAMPILAAAPVLLEEAMPIHAPTGPRGTTKTLTSTALNKAAANQRKEKYQPITNILPSTSMREQMREQVGYTLPRNYMEIKDTEVLRKMLKNRKIAHEGIKAPNLNKLLIRLRRALVRYNINTRRISPLNPSRLPLTQSRHAAAIDLISANPYMSPADLAAAMMGSR